MAGFRFSHRLNGGAPTIRNIVAADTTFNVGDLVNIESGTADLAATNDTKLAGVIIGPGQGYDTAVGDTITSNGTTETVSVIIDPDAVYAVVDANARLIGAQLDISGATGAQTVAASSNNDVIVIADSSATQPTLVCLSNANHFITSS